MYREYGLAREELKKQINEGHYDIIIVGGGIVGAGLFREQALHGLKVLLLDQADFNSQTSQGSSKMLHGGIRYLENMDFSLVFEALREKNLWLKLTPHITKEVPFYLPIYKESKWPLMFMRVGLFLYDFLSLFKNSPHRILNYKQTIKEMPGIKTQGLVGAGLYYDGIVDDAKLGLECIYDGLNNKNCKALNYQEVTSITKDENDQHTVEFQDTLNKDKSKATSQFVIMATGPFTDQAMSNLSIPWSPVILPSKGAHLWLEENSLPITEAMVLQTKDQRIIFVIPQRHSILVGTTEIPIDPKTPMLNIKPTQEEIQYLLDVVNEYFPESNVKYENILSSFAAVRPLVKAKNSSSKTSRNHKVFNPQKNLYVLVGGKYTTFRKMAQDLNKKIFKQLNIKHDKSLTLQPLRTTSIVENPFDRKISLDDLKLILKNENVRTKEDLLNRRLSLPTLRHFNDQDLESLILQLDFK
ncbi:MAG: glycerol-3-phosphate dehydrogenase [Bacteriovoracaceae bacterium]|jgi:glycerol-3-phosphate dehydrogenase